MSRLRPRSWRALKPHSADVHSESCLKAANWSSATAQATRRTKESIANRAGNETNADDLRWKHCAANSFLGAPCLEVISWFAGTCWGLLTPDGSQFDCQYMRVPALYGQTRKNLRGPCQSLGISDLVTSWDQPTHLRLASSIEQPSFMQWFTPQAADANLWTSRFHALLIPHWRKSQ